MYKQAGVGMALVISDTFTLDYNQFMEAHQTLRAFQPGQTNTRWDPSDLVLADGTRINIAAVQ